LGAIMDKEILKSSVKDYIHEDYIALFEEDRVEDALEIIREIKDDGKIVYYYTVNENGKLTGVLPVRRLINAKSKTKLKEISEKEIIYVYENENVFDVAKKFSSYKYLSMPVVTEENNIIGVIDLRIFTGKEKKFDIADKGLMDEIFNTIGIRVSEYRNASNFKAFQYRFPWLISTLASGFMCAILTSLFQTTLEKSIILTFFMTLILALGESISMQSMTLSFQELHLKDKSKARYISIFKKEFFVAILLGVSYGIISMFLSFFIGKDYTVSVVILITLVLESVFACFIGSAIPFVLYKFKLDPKISAGPVVLALTDIMTLAIYFIIGTLLLKY
jgi:magnesium transporter